MLYLKLAWRNIWRNKRRTLITIASIFFAVFFASMMRSLQEGSYGLMVDNMVSFFTGYGQVHKKGYWEEKTINHTFEYTDALKQLEAQQKEITAIVPRIESYALAANEERSKGAMVFGIQPEKEEYIMKVSQKLTKGTYFKADDKSVIVAAGLAKYLQLNIGDTLVLISQGYHGANAAGKYPVAGIAKFPLPDLNKQLVFLPLKEAQWFYAAENRLTSLAVMVEKPKQMEQALTMIKAHINEEEYDVMSWKEMTPELVQQIDMDREQGIMMLGILYIIIGFGIFGTILMMTTERRKEFGVLLAIGMKRFPMGIITWIEIIMLGAIGALLGILASIPISYYYQVNPIRFTGDMAKSYENFGIEPVLKMAVDSSIYFNQAFWVILITSILALYPIYKIFRMRPVDAMRA